MMASLQRLLQQLTLDDKERQFYSRSLEYLLTYSGRPVQLEPWMITSYEVEFGEKIGSGGLFVKHCFLGIYHSFDLQQWASV